MHGDEIRAKSRMRLSCVCIVTSTPFIDIEFFRLPGLKDIQKLSWVDSPDCILLAVVCSLLALYWLRESSSSSSQQSSPRIDGDDRDKDIEDKSYSWMDRILCRNISSNKVKTPVGVYLFFIGVIFAIVELATTKNEDGQYDLPLRFFGAPIAVLALEDVEANDWKTGFLDGALPQIPLTTLNSVISVCALAHSLYPEKRIHTTNDGTTIRKSDAVVTRKEVAISVGVMNILCCPFGGIPNCHGAGGLAGQHCFGARGGLSVAFLGFCKMMLAIFFGASALTLLDAVPTSVLSVMIIIAGQELATTGFNLLVKSSSAGSLRSDTVVAVITAAVILALQKTHYGAIAGWVTYMVYGTGIEQFWAWMQRRRNINEAAIDYDKPVDASDTSSDGSHVHNVRDSEGNIEVVVLSTHKDEHSPDACTASRRQENNVKSV